MQNLNSRMGLRVTAAALFAAVALAGCQQQGESLPPPRAASIESFAASATEVARGERITLSWKVADATGVSITQVGSGELTGVDDRAEGTLEVDIARSSLFLLSAQGEGGSDSRTVQVTIAGEAQAGVVFTAIPPEIEAGQASTLVWSAYSADSVTLTANGEAVDVGGVRSGTLSVTPQSTTSYVLTVDGEQREAVVTVTPAVLDVLASPESVQPDEQITVHWKAGGATEVVVSSPGRGVLYTETSAAKILDGSFSEAAPRTLPVNGLLTYVITASDGQRQASKEVQVGVGGNPSFTAFSLHDWATAGGSFTVTWKTVEATRLQVFVGEQVMYEAPDVAKVKSGSAQLPTPAQPTLVRVVASNPSGAVSKSVTVKPIDTPTVDEFKADLTTVPVAGTPVKLTWKTTNALKLRVEVRNAYTLAERLATANGELDVGELTVYPAETATEYVLAVDNTAGGTATSLANPVVVTVTVPGAPRFAPEKVPNGGMTSVFGHTLQGGAELHGLPTMEANAASDAFEDISAVGTETDHRVPPTVWAKHHVLPRTFWTWVDGKQVGGSGISVNLNGWFTFADGPKSGSITNNLPGTALEPNSFAPYWDELILVAESRIFFHLTGTGADERLIIQWNDVEKRSITGSRLTFQAKVYATGKVVYAYAKLQGLTTQDVSIGVVDAAETAEGSLVWSGNPSEGDTLTFSGMPKLGNFFVPRPAPYRAVVVMPGGAMTAVLVAPAALAADQFRITEVNSKPAPGVTDGEWVELTSTSAEDLDLRGWYLRLGGPTNQLLITDSVILPAGGRVVLAQSAGAGDGLPVDYVYGNANGISDTGATLALRVPKADPMDNTDYTAFSFGEVPAGDSVQHEALRTEPGVLYPFDVTAQTGAWCAAVKPYGTNGQRGTPGTPNSGCLPYSRTPLAPGGFQSLAPLGVPDVGVTPLVLIDEANVTVNLTQPLSYFGDAVSALTVSSNGYLSTRDVPCISPTDCYATNQLGLDPPSARRGLIAPFWDDLQPGLALSGVYVKENDPDGMPGTEDESVIVSWENWEVKAAPGTQLNFQMELFATGDVEFRYGAMDPTTEAMALGSSATVWLESLTGRAAWAISRNFTGIVADTGYRFGYLP